MVSIATARRLALSFPATDEHPHFEKKAFRVKKKIFATLNENAKRMMVKLSLIDQSVFCAVDIKIIYPVPGGWGKQGATIIELRKIKKELFLEMLTTAYCTVAPKKLAASVRPAL